MNIRRTLLFALALAALLVLLWWRHGPGDDAPLLTLSPSPRGGDFVLENRNGPVALTRFRGKVVVLYFGYTFCPDVCPAALMTLSQALAALDEAQQRQVQGLFVSVDPARDSGERLESYVGYFSPLLLGASGSREEIDRVTRRYGAGYRLGEANERGEYAVDHTSEIYIIDGTGRLAAVAPHGVTVIALTEMIAQHLQHSDTISLHNELE
ncbi:MAG: SCO family protein [Gammaproteobacteria bacterium]|nr:SCO family protein [Gammaproteobacteria bacterium]